MHIEILCTGDELLTGLTTDTNTPYFAARLLEALGEKVARVTTVGDALEEISAALKDLSSRCDALVVSGGLGPTADDVTLEAAAHAQGVELVTDERVLESIRQRFAARGIAFTENNARQARVPRGAEALVHPAGSAPMVVQRIGRCTCFFLPGVPREFRWLVDHEVLPRLERLRGPAPRVRRMRLLKVVGLPESHLDELVKPIAPHHPAVTFGFRTQAPENHLKLLAEGATAQEAASALEAASDECRAVLAKWLFGEGEQTLPSVVAERLRERGETVAVAESCTGGMVSALLTEPEGATTWFAGGAVAYHDSLKQRWAGVPADLLERHGAVSEPVARAMAVGIRNALGATYGLSVTGYAGPTGGTEEEPVGAFWCAVADANRQMAERSRVLGGRDRVRQFAAWGAVDLLRRLIVNDPRGDGERRGSAT